MIQCKCDTPDKIRLSQMKPFQGELKKRNQDDIKDLAQSLTEDGLLTPFFIWQNEETFYILDGHGRLQALILLAMSDASILEQEFPCILIQAATEDDARKALLQIVSTYGKIDKKGVINFSKPVINYKAPVLVKANQMALRPERRRIDPNEGTVIVKLRIHRDEAAKLMSLLKKVDGVEVL